MRNEQTNLLKASIPTLITLCALSWLAGIVSQKCFVSEVYLIAEFGQFKLAIDVKVGRTVH